MKVLASFVLSLLSFVTVAVFPWVARACNEAPCEVTCQIICDARSRTAILDPDAEFTVTVDISLFNTGGRSCGSASDVDLEYTVVQTDDFDDATEIVLDLPDELDRDIRGTGTVTFTFDADPEVGMRTFDIEITGDIVGGGSCDRVCEAVVYLGSGMTAEDASENTCALAGDPTEKAFCITNDSDDERTILFDITSIQTASQGPNGGGDHFPLAFAGEPLPDGHPEGTEIPEISGIVVVPANETAEVCFKTVSFPACGPGSHCIYRLTGEDLDTGDEVVIETSHLVVDENSSGCEYVECRNTVVCAAPEVSIKDIVGYVDGLSFATDFVIDNLDARIDITHDSRGELEVTLSSPQGTEVTLVESNRFDENDDITTVFDDSGQAYDADDLADDVTMQPAGPGTLADFKAEHTEGLWLLTVIDDSLDNTGTLNAWCLENSCASHDEGEFQRGDVQADGNISIIDAVSLLTWAFLDTFDLPCEDAADIDGNDEISALTDALYVLVYIFLDGPAPPDPFEECGVDEDDDLDCDTSTDGC